MYNTQENSWMHTINTNDSVQKATTTPSSSVIQQRGNVIVCRSEFIGDNNGKLSHNHYSQPPPTTHGEVDELPYAANNNKDDEYDNPIITSLSSGSTNITQLKTKTDLTNGNTKESTVTEKTAQSFVCQHCQKQFRHKSYYEYHLRTHTGDRPFQCNMCKKGFFERSKLNRHLSSCHNIPNNSYGVVGDDDPSQLEKSNACTKCNKTFSRSSGLQAHMQSHHDGKRPFSCTKCDKKFSGLTALKNHEKSHQGLKNILCDICGKGFLLKKYLDLHLNTTHKREVRKHRCSMCRKEFHSEKDLKRHQLMHSNAKNFTCSLCQTSFKRKDNLNRHLKLTHLLTAEQLSGESENSLESGKTNHDSGSHSDTSIVVTYQSPAVISAPPPVNQVSVIKSTHEVMMSITRGQQFI